MLKPDRVLTRQQPLRSRELKNVPGFFVFVNGVNMLEKLRANVDEIDEQIVELLKRRNAISRCIGAIKAQAGLPIVDLEREVSVIQKVKFKGEDDDESIALSNIYHAILAESRAMQANLRVGERAAK